MSSAPLYVIILQALCVKIFECRVLDTALRFWEGHLVVTRLTKARYCRTGLLLLTGHPTELIELPLVCVCVCVRACLRVCARGCSRECSSEWSRECSRVC